MRFTINATSSSRVTSGMERFAAMAVQEEVRGPALHPRVTNSPNSSRLISFSGRLTKRHPSFSMTVPVSQTRVFQGGTAKLPPSPLSRDPREVSRLNCTIPRLMLALLAHAEHRFRPVRSPTTCGAIRGHAMVCLEAHEDNFAFLFGFCFCDWL